MFDPPKEPIWHCLALSVTDLVALVQRLCDPRFEALDDEPLAGHDRRYAAEPFAVIAHAQTLANMLRSDRTTSLW